MDMIVRLIFLILLPINLYAASAHISEEDLQGLYKDLKCLLCDGQSVYESNSEFSEDIQSKAEELVLEGKTIAQIKEFFVLAYGKDILISKNPDPATILLWILPYILIFMIGLKLVISYCGKRKN